jgi:hypothetical protein
VLGASQRVQTAASAARSVRKLDRATTPPLATRPTHGRHEIGGVDHIFGQYEVAYKKIPGALIVGRRESFGVGSGGPF